MRSRGEKRRWVLRQRMSASLRWGMWEAYVDHVTRYVILWGSGGVGREFSWLVRGKVRINAGEKSRR
jgi:hypothetical protein